MAGYLHSLEQLRAQIPFELLLSYQSMLNMGQKILDDAE